MFCTMNLHQYLYITNYDPILQHAVKINLDNDHIPAHLHFEINMDFNILSFYYLDTKNGVKSCLFTEKCTFQ